MKYLLILLSLFVFSCEKRDQPDDNKIVIKGKVSLNNGEMNQAIMSYRASWLMSAKPNFLELDKDGRFEVILDSEDHISLAFGHAFYEPMALEFDPQFGKVYEFNVVLEKYQKSKTNEYYVVYDETAFSIKSESQKMRFDGNNYIWTIESLNDSIKEFRYQITYPGYRTFQGSQNVKGYDRSIDFYSYAPVINGKAEIVFNDSFTSDANKYGWFQDVKNMEYELSVIDFYNLKQKFNRIITEKNTKNEMNEAGLKNLFQSVTELINSKKEEKTKWYLAFLANRFYGNFTDKFKMNAEKASQYARTNIQEALYENYSIVSSIASLNAKEQNEKTENNDDYIVLFYEDLLKGKIGPYNKLRIYQSLADHYNMVLNDTEMFEKYCDKIVNEFPDTFNAMRIIQTRKKKLKEAKL